MLTTMRSLGAVIVGYLTIVVGALVFQEGLFETLTHESSVLALLVGGGLTAVACVVAGYVLAHVAPSRPVLHAIPLVVWLCIETTILHLRGDSTLWFDVLAGGSNVLGVVIGVYMWGRQHGQEKAVAS